MSKPKRYKKFRDFTDSLGIDPARALEAEMKANLTAALIREVEKQQLTHKEVAELSGIARSTVTGIITGSLQNVTIDRLLKILSGLGLSVEVKVKKSA